jgi:hypothetical protein
MHRFCIIVGCFVFAGLSLGGELLRLATFNVDATPPLGTPLAYDEMTWVDKPLSCRGVVLLGEGLPIVLCAVDWIGIANEGQDAFKEAFAEAAGTVPERVSVHTLHQHDAPVCDLSANRILTPFGLNGVLVDPVFVRQTIASAAGAIQSAIQAAVEVTHIGQGIAEVKEVASNRRILGPDGKVAFTRYTTCRDPKIRAMPVGIVDPMVRLVSFWNGDDPVAVMSYFATHPQSYYRTGGANPDFPGIARELRETDTGGVFQVHFNGAGGNVGAGKYNDGNRENRLLLALRLARGMKSAFEKTQKKPIRASDVSWVVDRIHLPIGEHLNEKDLLLRIGDTEAKELDRKEAARNLAWLRRCEAGRGNVLGCLKLGAIQILHCPGEMVVEYQLAAQKMQPDQFICLAAYGDYGPGYVCLTEHYAQGGYEASQQASRVAPSVETVLMPAIQRILER